jgi:hypothetical protein
MYNGQTRFVGRCIVINRRTGQLGALGKGGTQKGWSTSVPFLSTPWFSPTPAQKVVPPDDDLSEVKVSARFVPVPPPYEPPDEYNYPVIEVGGTRIPWWMWGIGGVLAMAAITSFVRK